MAISSTAPNYVGEVRAVIDDLRNNYLKKQQLFLQEKDQEDRLALGYAQLASQIDSSNKQLALSYAKLQSDASQVGTSSLLGRANDAVARARVLGSNAKNEAKADLDERKFQFEQWKELQKLEQEKKDRERDTESGRLLQEGLIAINDDNPLKLVEWTNKMAGSILTQKDRNDLYGNVLSLYETKRKLEQDGKNTRTQPEALGIVQQINMLDVESLTPKQFAASMDDLTKKFQALGNTDPKINDVFISVSTDVSKRSNEYQQKEYGKTFANYLQKGENGELPAEYQAEWAKIHQDFPDETTRLTSKDYTERLKRGMYQYNKAQSIAQLQSMEEQNRNTVEALVLQNPSLAAVKEDPETKQKYRVFPFPIPDLTPNEFSIDPTTGLLTKEVLDANKKWTAEIMTPNYLFGQVPFTRGLMANIPQTAQVDTSVPFRYESKTNFETVQVPGQTIIPAAPAAVQAVPPPPDVVAKIVTLYNSNPDAVYNGIPVREIIAKFRAGNVPLPGLVAFPEKPR